MAGPAVVTLGPANTETRYVVEDVPFGLLPIAVLGAIAGVETPFHAMGLRLFSALYGRDFVAENDPLPELRLHDLSPAALRELCRNGHAPRMA